MYWNLSQNKTKGKIKKQTLHSGTLMHTQNLTSQGRWPNTERSPLKLFGQTQWSTPIITTLGKWRQEEQGPRWLLSKFEASLGYIRPGFKTKVGQRDGSVIKSTHCSCRGLAFVSKCPHHVAQNHLQLHFQGVSQKGEVVVWCTPAILPFRRLRL